MIPVLARQHGGLTPPGRNVSQKTSQTLRYKLSHKGRRRRAKPGVENNIAERSALPVTTAIVTGVRLRNYLREHRDRDIGHLAGQLRGFLVNHVTARQQLVHVRLELQCSDARHVQMQANLACDKTADALSRYIAANQRKHKTG